MQPLKDKLGVMLLQLPAGFGPNKLSVLDRFLSQLPPWLNVAVEVRHLSFFEKAKLVPSSFGTLAALQSSFILDF